MQNSSTPKKTWDTWELQNGTFFNQVSVFFLVLAESTLSLEFFYESYCWVVKKVIIKTHIFSFKDGLFTFKSSLV